MTNEKRDLRLAPWRPFKVGDVAVIRAKHVGPHAGAVVRIVEVLDGADSPTVHMGIARLRVECIPLMCRGLRDPPFGGLDPAGQHDGMRIDVCRFELRYSNKPQKSLARQLARLPDAARADDRRINLGLPLIGRAP